MIEELLDSVTQFLVRVRNDLGDKFISFGYVIGMDVDEILLEKKGKYIVGRDNLDMDGKASFSLAREYFILNLLTNSSHIYISNECCYSW